MANRCEVIVLRHDSDLLRDNPLGDPHVRDVVVVTPPRFSPERPTPVIFWLAGFGSRGRDLLKGHALDPDLLSMFGLAMNDGTITEALLVLPDCSTRYGGSQYINSPTCGRYLDHLVDELVPFIDATFATTPGMRAIMGKSSGGYGAILAAISRPGVFQGVCAHTPDAGFESCYLPLVSITLDTFSQRGGFAKFAADPSKVFPKDTAYMVAMSLVAMAACYAPTQIGDLSRAFPFDPDTGTFRTEVWQSWIRHDPTRIVQAETAAANLRALRFLFLDVGTRDEYGMYWGVRALHDTLKRAGIPHVYEEHEAGHHGIEHRIFRSLSALHAAWGLAIEDHPDLD